MEFNMIFFLLLYFDYLFYFFCVIAGITAHRRRRRARRVLAAVIPQAPRHRAPLAPEVNTKVPQPNRVARAARLGTTALAALAAPSLVLAGELDTYLIIARPSERMSIRTCHKTTSCMLQVLLPF